MGSTKHAFSSVRWFAIAGIRVYLCSQTGDWIAGKPFRCGRSLPWDFGDVADRALLILEPGYRSLIATLTGEITPPRRRLWPAGVKPLLRSGAIDAAPTYLSRHPLAQFCDVE
jgi:hypothetical protein